MLGISFGGYEIICCILFIVFSCLVVHWYSGNISFAAGIDTVDSIERPSVSLNGESVGRRSRWPGGGPSSYSWLGPLSGFDSANVAELAQRLHQADHQLTLTRRHVEALHIEISALDEENHRLFKNNQQLKRHYRKAKKKLQKFEEMDSFPRVKPKNPPPPKKDLSPTQSDILIGKKLLETKSSNLINNNFTD